MKINIYYGGRGLLDDPTIYVIGKMTEVLEELRVKVQRYNIYEQKNSIATLPQTLKDADGVIFATTVEWLGIGGYMHQFLDACWLYADKDRIKDLYMQPVVMSTTYGEKEAYLNLTTAWDTLGGLPCSGLSGYVEDLLSFQMNEDYGLIIEKKAENLYRTISQNIKSLPCSSQAVTRSVAKSGQLELTPQESEQLSKYVSDDEYVRKQKEDLAELADMFKNKIGESVQDEDTAYIIDFESHYVPQDDCDGTFSFMIEGKKKPLTIQITDGQLVCHYGQEDHVDHYIKIGQEALEGILDGRMTFQKAFFTGELSNRGDFNMLKNLDRMFIFSEDER
ncbi:MAG: SCP2 sterol-binding domain-containing protein [Lachnospiraceae bacterium]|nr:SCP2 sterol-binding domain-containing protein [Lachnospiraceae bacterium]